MKTRNPAEDFKGNFFCSLYASAYEVITDCLDYACKLVQPRFPRAVRPEVYVVENQFPNAGVCTNNHIEVYTGLFEAVADMVEVRYTDERLQKYGLLTWLPGHKIRSLIRVYAWRFTLMHELYHVWHNHLDWLNKYYFSDSGTLETRPNVNRQSHIRIDEVAGVNASMTMNKAYQHNLTIQALEFDADSCAINMLVNFMMSDYDNRVLSGQDLSKVLYARENTALLIAAMSTLFCVFDKNRGAAFSALAGEMLNEDHPIPPIRMYHAEDVMNAMMFEYFEDAETVRAVEGDWLVVDTDLEADNGVTIDWRNDFKSPAYTPKSQAHLSMIKRRMREMYDTMNELATGNMPPKLDEDDLAVHKEAIIFTDDGQSLRGWP